MSVSCLWVTGFRSFKDAAEECRTRLQSFPKRTGIGNFWSTVHGAEHTLLGISWLYQVRMTGEAWNYRLCYRNGQTNVIVKLTVKFYMEWEVYIQLPIHPVQMRLGLFLTRHLFFPCQWCYRPLGVTDPIVVTYSVFIGSCPNTINFSILK